MKLFSCVSKPENYIPKLDWYSKPSYGLLLFVPNNNNNKKTRSLEKKKN